MKEIQKISCGDVLEIDSGLDNGIRWAVTAFRVFPGRPGGSSAEIVLRKLPVTATISINHQNQEKNMANELKPGDVVMLKSGGPEMTTIAAEGQLIWCSWMDCSERRSSSFPPEALKLIRAAPPPEPTALEEQAAVHRAASEEKARIRRQINIHDAERQRLRKLEDEAGDRADRSGERMKQLARGEPEATGRTDGGSFTTSTTPSSA